MQAAPIPITVVQPLVADALPGGQVQVRPLLDVFEPSDDVDLQSAAAIESHTEHVGEEVEGSQLDARVGPGMFEELGEIFGHASKPDVTAERSSGLGGTKPPEPRFLTTQGTIKPVIIEGSFHHNKLIGSTRHASYASEV